MPFTVSTAERTSSQLLLALVGPSGTGKTYSALRLAAGIQRVTGGDIFGIDTENERMLHYAPLKGEKPDPGRGKFDFKYIAFPPPYGSLRYLEAIQYAASLGAKTIVVDSFSHEHEGTGGMLESHSFEADRLAREADSTPEAMNAKAWGIVKPRRTRLISALMTELKVNLISCFRAKPKLKYASKDEQREKKIPAVSPRGFCAIAGEEFIFEQMIKFVLLPGARGAPSWMSEFSGEREMMKIPEQFLHIFPGAYDPKTPPIQLSEEIGQQMAEWAAGGATKYPSDDECAAKCLLARGAKTLEELDAVQAGFRGPAWSTAQRAKLKAALEGRTKELETKK